MIRPITGAVHITVVKKEMNKARLPRNVANDDNDIGSIDDGDGDNDDVDDDIPKNSVILSSNRYINTDAHKITRQNAFSLVSMGKFDFSNSAYRMKKYFMASLPIGPRAAMTFSGTEKCCMSEVLIL